MDEWQHLMSPSQLKKMLKDAVDVENYEGAALVRDVMIERGILRTRSC